MSNCCRSKIPAEQYLPTTQLLLEVKIRAVQQAILDSSILEVEVVELSTKLAELVKALNCQLQLSETKRETVFFMN